MATPFRLKRSSVTGKRPDVLQKGELAINFYDGHLFAERDTGGVGIGTTITLLTPWKEAFGGGAIHYTGVVTATRYEGEGGNLTLGTPTSGSYRTGATSLTSSTKVDNSIETLNYILGKLVPNEPDNIGGVALTLDGAVGTGRLCSGFTPTNNSGAAAPVAGTQYTRNTDSTITTAYITEYGPGDSGTIEGFVNATGIGSTAFNDTFGQGAIKSDNGTFGALQIANDKDAAESTRNVGITSLFYEVYDARFINAASPDGYNKAHMSQGANNTANVFWYEDPSTVGAPVISYSAVVAPSSPTLNYSSGIPHYTEASANKFCYVMTVTNATGDMYTEHEFVTADAQTTGFLNPGSRTYSQFAGGANPPARNYGVGTGVTSLMNNLVRNIHTTITSDHFSAYSAVTPYGSHNAQRVGYGSSINIMGTTATTTQVDEDNILITSLGTGSGNADRVNAGATGDNPTAIYTAWSANSAVVAYEAVVRGGVLRHDQVDYSSGYVPAGPDYSSGRTGAQYFQVELIRSNVSDFRITVAGTYGGCWVCMPDNTTWTGALSGNNGWADMSEAYRGAGIPTSAEAGCAIGAKMTGSGGTFTCTLGTESSSNDTNNRILVRFRLDAGDSITNIQFSAT